MSNYYIGQKILRGPSYPMKCSERFGSTYNDMTGKHERHSIPTPKCLHGQGFVIGLKRAIVSDYKYTAENTTQGSEDSYPETVPAYATGKYEECLVVITAIKPFKPYLVRKANVL